MQRHLPAWLVCLGLLSVPAAAAGPADRDTIARHYDAADLAEGRIQITTVGDVAYVQGTVRGGPWMEVWRRTDGGWRRVAEVSATELAPIRFGAKRDHHACRRTS